VAHFEKHFTLEEANALLPELRRLLAHLQTLRGKLVVDWEQAKPVVEAAPMNGGGKEAAPFLADIYALNNQVRKIVEMGVQLKDLERGLVDFPAWKEDREVFLCWHLGEDRIEFWHELETGFSGRKAL